MHELFKIAKEQLNLVIDTFNNIVSDKSPDIIHSSIRISVGDKIHFICKNFESYMCKSYDNPIETKETKDFIVGVGIFSSLVKKLESSEVTFLHKEDKLIIEDNNSKFTLDTMKVNYPERNIENFKFLCEVNCDYLKKRIKLCLLKLEQGVFSFNFAQKSYIVARDNRKLAVCNLAEQTIADVNINISNNIVNEILNICSYNTKIKLLYSDTEILLETENYFLVCKNHWARSINYLELCKTDFFSEVVLNTSSIKRILKKLKLMSPPLTNTMNLEFQTDGIIISVFNPSIGSAREEVKVQHSLKNFSIKLNIVHFINILDVLDSSEFSIFILDSKSKVVIKSEAIYLLMPLSF